MAINVTATPFSVTVSPAYAHGTVSHSDSLGRNPELDQSLFLTPAQITLTLSGTWSGVAASDTLLEITLTLSGTLAEGTMLDIGSTLELELELLGDIVLQLSKSNWVKWSNIGSLDFAVGRDNIAGERPMSWAGTAHVARKLGRSIVIYGDGGVSVMVPHDYKWGYDKISGIGLHSRLAICGDEKVHYYVDKKNRLCRLGEKLEVLGYDEFIGGLSDSLVLSYDEQLGRVFICDGQYGYVYSYTDKGFGRGPGNITGWSTDLIAASAAITSLPFEICTDIYDLGSRKAKTISSIDLGVDASLVIYAAIDWRKDKTSAFATTPWTRVNPNGTAVIPCWGHEFRFRVRQLTYEYFELDYIKVNGTLHNYSFLDSFLRGRQV